MTASAPRQISDDPGGDLRLDDYLPYRLSVASNAVSRLIAKAYEDRFGLSVPQWRVVCLLAENGALTQEALVRGTGMEPAIVSHAVGALAGRELAEARSGAKAVHAGQVALTDTGRRLHGQIAPLALAYEAAILSGLTPQEVALLKRLLRRLQGAALVLAGEAVEASRD